MFSLHRGSMTFVRLAVAVLLLAALPVAAGAAPASAPDDRADLIVTARQWAGELLDAVLAAFGLTGSTDDPDTTLTGTGPVDDPASTTDAEPDKTNDDEGGHWDPNG